jgi:opacity protein-like surface antigen
MRVFTKGFAALTAGMLMSAPVAMAQGAEFSLGGGLGIPLGDFDDAVKLGWMGLAGVSFVPNGSPVGIQVDGQFQQYKIDGSSSLKDRIIMGTANAVCKFKTSEETRFRPYLIGGGGVYNLKTTGTDDLGGIIDTDNSTTKFGLNAGAGFDFKAGSAGLFIEARFHDVFTEGSDVQFVPITVGVRFGGS